MKKLQVQINSSDTAKNALKILQFLIKLREGACYIKVHAILKNEKFIQEVLWRTYWKGWLELRPNVWTDYLTELNQIKRTLCVMFFILSKMIINA